MKYELLGEELTFEEFDYLICQQNNGKQLVVEDGKVIARDRVITQQEINTQKIAELKQNLSNTDYVANKLSEEIATSFVTGDNSSVIALRNKYFKILADRDAWREEINRLEEELKNGNE